MEQKKLINQLIDTKVSWLDAVSLSKLDKILTSRQSSEIRYSYPHLVICPSGEKMIAFTKLRLPNGEISNYILGEYGVYDIKEASNVNQFISDLNINSVEDLYLDYEFNDASKRWTKYLSRLNRGRIIRSNYKDAFKKNVIKTATKAVKKLTASEDLKSSKNIIRIIRKQIEGIDAYLKDTKVLDVETDKVVNSALSELERKEEYISAK